MEILLTVLAIVAGALLWIGWNLHRLTKLALNWTEGYEAAVRERIARGEILPPPQSLFQRQ